jgi:hypothetical protein
MEAIERGLVDLVINIPRTFDAAGRPDGYLIRRAAVDAHIPVLTELKLARMTSGSTSLVLQTSAPACFARRLHSRR